MRTRGAASLVAALAALALSAPAPVAADAADDRLLTALAEDPAYKVRMRALTLLRKRHETRPDRPEQVVLAIGRAATADDSHIVRGLACHLLGVLHDPRGRPSLESASRDPHPFVRAQAEDALRALSVDAIGGGRPLEPPAGGAGPATPPRASRRSRPGSTDPEPGGGPAEPALPLGGRPALVIEVEPMPGVELAASTLDALRDALQTHLRSQAGGRYDVGGNARGFALRGTIAERTAASVGRETKLTLVVRVTIATRPGNHLRHVVTARASAKVAGARGVERLERKLIEAAAARAVRDAVAAIGSS